MSDQSRRKLLKSIAAGSGAIAAGKSLPESWSRPVVDSVMLPAHAETSACQAVDDEFTPNSPSAGEGSVSAPGILENDSCTQVVSNTNPVINSGTATTIVLIVNADGSFSYQTDGTAIFTFNYTTESGATASVIVNHI